MKVRVSSYQSIASAEVEAVGFTAVTGPSNIGKSAFLRAVAAALFGQDGDHFIRQGKPACVIAVEHDGHVIEWQKVRRKKPGLENCVVVDGEKFTRLGKGHGELVGSLGYQTIKAGGEQIQPQYATQFDDIFLLTATPNTAAEVFKMLGRVDVVTRAHGAARSDLRKAGSELEIRTRDSEVAWEALCELGWVEAFEPWYQQVVKEVASRAGLESMHQGLLEGIERLERLGDSRILPEEPELSDAGPIEELLKRIEEYARLAPRGKLPAEPGLADHAADILVLEKQLEAIEAFEGARAAEDEVTRELEHTCKAEAEAVNAVATAEAELGVCPVCNRRFRGSVGDSLRSAS